MNFQKAWKNYILPVTGIALLSTALLFAVHRQQAWTDKPAWLARVLEPLNTIEAMELKTLDLRFIKRGGYQYPDPQLADRVKVVAVDSESVAQVGRWPWPRGVMGRLVDSVCGDPFSEIDDSGWRDEKAAPAQAQSDDDEGWEDAEDEDDGWEDVDEDDESGDEGWEDVPDDQEADDDGWEDVPGDEEQDEALADADDDDNGDEEPETADADDEEEETAKQNPPKEYGKHRVLGIDVLLDREERDYSAFLLGQSAMMDPNKMDAMARYAISRCDRAVLIALMKFPSGPDADVGTGDEYKVYKDRDGGKVIYNMPLKTFQTDNVVMGYANVEPSRYDERVRKARLYYQLGGRTVYSFALVNVAAFAGVPLKDIKVRPGLVTVGKYRIPTDSLGRIYINYSGYKGKVYDPAGKKGFPIAEATQISAIDIMKTPETIPFTLKGNFIFLIGVTDPEMRDILYTPHGFLPGVDVHKATIDTILQQDFLSDTPAWKFVLALLIGSALVGGFALYRIWAGAAALGAFSVGYWFFAMAAFKSGGVIYPVAPVLLALPVAMVCGILYRNFVVDREKNAVKNIFKSYVAPHVLAELMENPEDLKLGGKSSKVSILFSDIRGFTTISEQLNADQLISALNHYLENMTEIVLDNSGMIDKFIGDAVMAIWGAPVPHEDDAARAVRAALKMQPILDRINPHIKQITGLEFAIGVGVNTGEAKLGNIGSKGKLDYTVIGDAVNLASRLEGLTKQYGAFLIISEFTYEEVKDQFECRYLDDVMVKGKDKPVGIYQVLAEKGQLDDARKRNMDHFHRGRELYKAMKFDEAIAEFEKAIEIDHDDKASKMYAHERCPHYRDNPPPQGWDGAFRMTTK
jgi:adenylate cyclase